MFLKGHTKAELGFIVCYSYRISKLFLFSSEVWRAFDLDENKYVACKIHHVNREWKEDKKVCLILSLTFFHEICFAI